MNKTEGVPHWARCLTPWTSPGQNTGVGNIPLLRGSSQPRDRTQVSPLQADSLLAEPGKPKNAGVGSLSLLQGIFPTQESSQGLLHCRRVLYQMSYQGSPPYWARHPIGSFAWYPLPEASTWQPTMIHTGAWVGGSRLEEEGETRSLLCFLFLWTSPECFSTLRAAPSWSSSWIQLAFFPSTWRASFIKSHRSLRL